MRLKNGVTEKDLPRRLVLVQDPPRSLRLVCSLLAPSSVVPPTLALPPEGIVTSAAKPGAVRSRKELASVPSLVRKLCLLDEDAPFAGKVVSRPCPRTFDPEASGGVHPQSSFTQAVLSTIGLGGTDSLGIRDNNGGHWSGDSSDASFGSGSCQCTVGGGNDNGSDAVSSCAIRVPPGRNPCLYVEADESSFEGGQREADAAGIADDERGTFGADSVDITSLVQLRTFSVPTRQVYPETGADSNEVQQKEPTTAMSAATNAMYAVAASRAEAVRRRLPPRFALPELIARLFAGAVLLFLAQPLSESRVFHYLLSALLGATLGAAGLVIRVLGDPRRTFLR